VRQLAIVFQVFWVDILFALFTDRSQRAFELLSKTRVVDAEERPHEAVIVGMTRGRMTGPSSSVPRDGCDYGFLPTRTTGTSAGSPNCTAKALRTNHWPVDGR
jgi:hypothetical protein